ncbi:uncharacterized protein PEZ65_016361 [Lycodopsis pacificus]
MEHCGSMMKSVLVAIVLVSVLQSGSAAEKLSSCCKRVTRQEITDPILGWMLQQRNLPCVRAVIFQTKAGLFCTELNAAWVRPKIVAFEKAKARLTAASPVSLLSIITSTASPSSSSSSSSLPPSSTSPSSSSSSSPSSSSSSSSSPPHQSSLLVKALQKDGRVASPPPPADETKE